MKHLLIICMLFGTAMAQTFHAKNVDYGYASKKVNNTFKICSGKNYSVDTLFKNTTEFHVLFTNTFSGPFGQGDEYHFTKTDSLGRSVDNVKITNDRIEVYKSSKGTIYKIIMVFGTTLIEYK